VGLSQEEPLYTIETRLILLFQHIAALINCSILVLFQEISSSYSKGPETAYELSVILDEMQINAVPPEVEILLGFGNDKDQDFINLSEHISKLSNQLIVTVSTLDSFPFEDFKLMVIHTANLARGVSMLPYTNKVLGELLVGYAASLVNTGIQFSGSVARVLNQNPMDLSLALPRKGNQGRNSGNSYK
jgi:hypothetical protein